MFLLSFFVDFAADKERIAEIMEFAENAISKPREKYYNEIN